jgi:putative tricarboxylic transport membrane protein
LLDLSSHKRDYYAGALMMLLGLGASLEGQRYGIGTLTRMGPGFFPVALGVIMVLVGILIAGSAYVSTEAEKEHFFPAERQWRGWLCIIASPILFILFGEYAGLLPATFACVFIAALGDKEATLKSSFILAAGVTFFGILLFSYVLKISFPIIRGIWY